jgi:hypothetical protein
VGSLKFIRLTEKLENGRWKIENENWKQLPAILPHYVGDRNLEAAPRNLAV